MSEKHQKLDQLMAALIDGSIDKQQFRQIESLLLDQPEAQKRYLYTLDLNAELLKKAKLETPVLSDADDRVIHVPRPGKPRWNMPFPLTTLVAACIMLVMGITIGQLLKLEPNTTESTIVPASQLDHQQDDGVALLKTSLNITWDQASDWDVGHDGILSPGTIAFKTGIAQIEMYSGARLIAEGPANLNLRNMNEVMVNQGKVRVILPPHADDVEIAAGPCQFTGFAEEGTEFGIDFPAKDDLQLAVYQGNVSVMRESESSPIDLEEGQGLLLPSQGQPERIPIDNSYHTSEYELARRKAQITKDHLVAWQHWQKQIKQDKRLRVYYDFEPDQEGLHLVNRTPKDEANAYRTLGTIIGAEWNRGRWPDKNALEFKRPSDRVRLNIPGSYPNLTLCAWVRVDSLPNRKQSLLLTDGYNVGYFHWQLDHRGALRLSVRKPSQTWKEGNTGYVSKPLFTPRAFGTWIFLVTAYDMANDQVRHYFNGKLASRIKIKYRQPLKIGPSNIGNWSIQKKENLTQNQIRHFVGRMDEIMIWSVALTDQKVRELYVNGRPY